MDLKIKVKVGEINNLSDARYCAGMGVELIGFSLDETNVKYMDPARVAEISNWLTGVQLVGEFDAVSLDQIEEVAKILPLNFIQLNISSADPENLKKLPLPLIIQTQVSDVSMLAEQLEKFKPLAKYFLVEGNGDLKEEEALWKSLCQNYDILLGYGVTKDNLEYILHTIKPAGLALKGGVEIRPGLKDFEELSEILESLEPDEYNF